MRKLVATTVVTVSALTALCAVMANDDIQPEPLAVSAPELLDSANTEAEFLEGLHYSHEEFLRVYESLPRDEENKIDWESAVEQGLIDPASSIDDGVGEEMLMDLRVVVKFNDMLIKDVVFSHKVHTYWLNCESCHPRVFKPEIGANPMTMSEIREGKYCGLCHGSVAFPTNVVDAPNFRANCLRCHRAQRG